MKKERGTLLDKGRHMEAKEGIFFPAASMWRLFYFCGQRAKRTCVHVHLAVLCAGGTRLAPTEVERRPAAAGKSDIGNFV